MPPPADDAKMMSLRQRIIVAIVFGLIVGLAAVQSMVVGSAFGYADHGPPSGTLRRLQNLAHALTAYQTDRGELPADLETLYAWERLIAKRDPPIPSYRYSGYREGAVLDGWGNPIIYTRMDGSFRLTSLGSDGQPSGEGIASDIVCTSPDIDLDMRTPPMTFGQFWAEKRSFGMMNAASVITLMAGSLCFALLRRNLASLILPGILTLLATLAVAQFIGMLDIVKYH